MTRHAARKRPHHPDHHAPRRSALVACALVVLLPLLALLAPAGVSGALARADAAPGALRLAPSAVRPQLATEPAPPRDGGTEQLALVHQTTTVPPDGEFRAQVRVTGAPAGSHVRTTLYRRLDYRSDFQRSLTPSTLRNPLTAPTRTPVDASSGLVDLTIATRDVEPGADRVLVRQGVHPVRVELIDPAGSVLDEFVTHLVRAPREEPDRVPLNVAIVVPIGGVATNQADGTFEVDPADRTAASATTSVLASHPEADVDLAIAPQVVDAMADGADAALLDRLRAAASSNAVLPATYVPLSPTAWWNAGLAGQLDDQVRSATAALRSLGTPPARTWFARHGLNPGAAKWLRDQGWDRLVLPEATLGPAAGSFRFTIAQRFALHEVDGVSVLAADGGLSSHIDASSSPVLDAQHLLADLAMIAYDGPLAAPRVAVVAPPGDEPLDPRFLDAVLAGLAPGVNPLARTTTLDAAFDAVGTIAADGTRDGEPDVDPLRRSLAPPPDDDLAALGPALVTTAGRVAAFRAAVDPSAMPLAHRPSAPTAGGSPAPAPDDPGLDGAGLDAGVPQPLRHAHRLVLAAGHRSVSPPTRAALLDRAVATIDGELAKVTTPDRQRIRFAAREGVVSLVLRNATGYPMAVTLHLDGSKLTFPQHPDGTIPLLLRDEVTRLDLQVHARASGDSPLDIRLTSPDGSLAIDDTRITIRSTSFSGIGLVLSVGAGAFLVLWWARSTRRDRQAKRERRAGHPSAQPAPADGPAPGFDADGSAPTDGPRRPG